MPEPAKSPADTSLPPVRVAIVGCGYWGPNLVRNFSTCPLTIAAMICDRDESRLAPLSRSFPQVKPVTDFEAVLNAPDIEAVVIATPVATHGPLAARALAAGKHVLVEKPLAATVREADELVQLADRHDRILMVDHTYLYSSPVRMIKGLIDRGELGELYYFDSVRINLGMIQHDTNVVWDLAPHDLSIVEYLLGRLPRSIAATGTCHTGTDIEDVAYMSLDFGDNLIASFHVNWLSPIKIRHFIIGGSKKGLVYNDLDPVEPIKVYDRGINMAGTPEQRRGMLISYRTGDVWSPHVDRAEPLQRMVTHFAECIRNKTQPISDGRAGKRVVQILEAAQRSIKAQGGRITL